MFIIILCVAVHCDLFYKIKLFLSSINYKDLSVTRSNILRALERIFYIIFNIYYKHGNYKNDTPAFRVFLLFLVCCFNLLLALAHLIKFLIKGPYTSGRPLIVNIFIAVLAIAIPYYLFLYKKKYVEIYEKYKEDEFANSMLGRITAISFALLCFLSPFIVIYFIRLSYI